MDSFYNKRMAAGIVLKLQHFASDDKTEKATPKKRQDVRKKGQVLQSREINSAIVLICVFLGLKLFGGFIYSEVTGLIRRLLEEYPANGDMLDIHILAKVFYDCTTVLLKATGPIMAVALVSGTAASYSQVGFLFTTEVLNFKFERINPLSGFKRMFSSKAAVELLKAVMKITIIGYAAFTFLKDRVQDALNLMMMDVRGITAFIGNVAADVSLKICMVVLAFAGMDYFYQWWEYEKNLKMTKQEIKDEYKQMDGNPEIKSKIKQKQRQISMQRMMQDIPKADVVITNPTHFAVAIRYDQTVSDAPMVIAKGQDFLAKRIKEIAKENKIEVVENKPLARTLYSSVEIGERIPPELYQAVAEVLAFVYSLKK